MLRRTDQSLIGQWWWTIDRWLFVAILALMALGVFLIAAASPSVAERINMPSFHFLIRHFIFLVPSVLLLFIGSLMSKKTVWRAGSVLFVGTIFLLVVTLLFGVEIKGSTRWIHLAGFSLQPSEFLKPTFAIVGAWLIAKQHHDPSFKGKAYMTVLYLLSLFLLIAQPDFGMSFVLTSIWVVQIFLAGLSLALIFVLAVLGAVAVLGSYFALPHVKSRIDRFLNPSSGDNFQIEKSLKSFHEGGIFGTGPGEGSVKTRLPDAHADFIFSVAGEELGLIVTLIIIGLFLFVIIRGGQRIYKSTDMFVLLAVSGILTQFAVQTLVHMGSSLRLLPAKGMTLPFVSYGGSSLVSLAIAMGFVLALTRKDKHVKITSKEYC